MFKPARWTLLILSIALAGCGREETPEVSHTAAAQKQEPLFQPHDWQPKTRDLEVFGREYPDAIEIADGIYQTRGTSNVAMVVTDEGNVVIDTGLPPLPFKGNQHKKKLDRVSTNPVSHIILTHAHGDHYGARKTSPMTIPRSLFNGSFWITSST